MTCPPSSMEQAKVPQTPADAQGCWKTRYTFVVLSLFALANVYAMRANMSVAIVAMVNQTALVERSIDVAEEGGIVLDEEDTCPGEVVVVAEDESSSMNGVFLWDEQKQGEILAAFFYGYTIGHIPGGVMADRFGGKLVIGLSVLVTAITSLLTPPCAWISVDLVFALRLIQGFAQGGIIPAIQCMMSKWAPQQERARFSVVYFGTFVGLVSSLALTGFMSESAAGWPLSFYFFGVLGLVWCIPWYLLVFNSPAEHPRIDAAEKTFIEASVGEAIDRKQLAVPWRHLLLSLGVWSCSLVQIGVGWEYNFVLTYLPLYMANILKFDLHSNGVLSSIPYIAGGAASLLFSSTWQIVLRSGWMSRLNVYRLGNAIMLLTTVFMLFGVTLVGCNSAAIIAMMAIGNAALAINFSNNYSNILVLAPNYSGTIIGITNTFANGTGIIVPYVVAAFTKDNQTRSAWNSVFYLSSGIGALSYISSLILSTDKEQPWNDPAYVADKKRKDKGVGYDGPQGADVDH